MSKSFKRTSQQQKLVDGEKDALNKDQGLPKKPAKLVNAIESKEQEQQDSEQNLRQRVSSEEESVLEFNKGLTSRIAVDGCIKLERFEPSNYSPLNEETNSDGLDLTEGQVLESLSELREPEVKASKGGDELVKIEKINQDLMVENFKGFDLSIPANRLKFGLKLHQRGVANKGEPIDDVQILGDPIQLEPEPAQELSVDIDGTQKQLYTHGPLGWVKSGDELSLMIKKSGKFGSGKYETSDFIHVPSFDLVSFLRLKLVIDPFQVYEGYETNSQRLKNVLNKFKISNVQRLQEIFEVLKVSYLCFSENIETQDPQLNMLNVDAPKPKALGALGHSYKQDVLKTTIIHKLKKGFEVEEPSELTGGVNPDGVHNARDGLNLTKLKLNNGALYQPEHWITTGFPFQYIDEMDRPKQGSMFENKWKYHLGYDIRKQRLENAEYDLWKNKEFMDLVKKGYLESKRAVVRGVKMRDFNSKTYSLKKLLKGNYEKKPDNIKLKALISVQFAGALEKDDIYGQIEYAHFTNWSWSLKDRFLNKHPVLNSWLPTLVNTQVPAIWEFVLRYMETMGEIMDPVFWNGHDYFYVLVLYYVQSSKSHLLYDKTDKSFYKYNGVWWELITHVELISAVTNFYSNTIKISGITSFLSKAEKVGSKLLNDEIKEHIAIDEWPHMMGYNVKNGFLTLIDGKYVLRPHHPGHFQKRVYDISIPDSIVVPMTQKNIRFQMDMAGNQTIAANTLKIADFISFSPGKHNIIVNYTGNPQGTKSQKISLLRHILKGSSSVGEFSVMNTFQLKDLLMNKNCVIFPDASVNKMTDHSKDTLKRISGRDGVSVEYKHGANIEIKPIITPIFASNVNLEDFRAASDVGMADRLLTIRTPSIDRNVRVTGLVDSYLSDPYNLMNYFTSTLTISPFVVERTTRAGDLNGITGLIKPTLLEFFLKENLVVDKGGWLRREVLRDNFNTFIKTEALAKRLRRPDEHLIKTNIDKSFTQSVNKWLGNQDPKCDYVRRKIGYGWKNISLGNTEGDSSQTQTPTHLKLAKDVPFLNAMKLNPFKQDQICFHAKDGKPVVGPRLNPLVNLKTYLNFIKARVSNLREIIHKERVDIAPNTHLENTDFATGSTLSNFGLKDFIDSETFEFQAELIKLDNNDLDQNWLTGRFLTTKSNVSPLFLGAPECVLIGPNPLYRLQNEPLPYEIDGQKFRYLVGDSYFQQVYSDYAEDPAYKASVDIAIEPVTKGPKEDFRTIDQVDMYRWEPENNRYLDRENFLDWCRSHEDDFEIEELPSEKVDYLILEAVRKDLESSNKTELSFDWGPMTEGLVPEGYNLDYILAPPVLPDAYVKEEDIVDVGETEVLDSETISESANDKLT